LAALHTAVFAVFDLVARLRIRIGLLSMKGGTQLVAGRFALTLASKHRGASAMIEKRVWQLETDVRILTSLVAKLETQVHAQSTETQQAIHGLAKQVADLTARIEEIRHVGSAVHALS
jgi:outer membrane murein-binding lipoprotein Lpp